MRKETLRRKHPGGRNFAPSTSLAAESPILVSRIAGSKTHGKLIWGTRVVPCALGRGGTIRAKREGDGATPVGTWTVIEVRWRGDRIARRRAGLPMRMTRPQDGWCDDPGSRLYNRPVTLPCRVGHEDLWRVDGLYDVVVVLDYNLRRPARGRGSAIFFHLTAPDRRPTAGCVAIDRAAMLRLLPRLRPGSRIKVLA
ncbi:MAG TPA: L,D-transpeptidase family protein [Lichenihabitans sp.]|nr:L,D-transpeptidase family protein [Lichenihabitans sp.]